MVELKDVEEQLRRIKFNGTVWNRAETLELPNILHDDETISECAHGLYEGGFALLIATDIRVLLVDKKPLNYLTVEDMRFDTINELDYSHRLLSASITISAGNKTLKFKSYNQPRLRKLIGHVQTRMTDLKKEASDKTDTQQLHLEEINKQLQMYLLAQQQQLQMQTTGQVAVAPMAEAVKPSPQLSDYLFAQRLLEKFQAETGKPVQIPAAAAQMTPLVDAAVAQNSQLPGQSAQQIQDDLLAEGQREVFGKVITAQPAVTVTAAEPASAPAPTSSLLPKSLEINSLKIAYSKLPMALRNRRFGRPSYHAHSQSTAASSQTQPVA